MMLANPWLLLGLLVFWLASVSGAYYKGSQHAQDAARAQYATDLEASIQKANETAKADIEAARAAGQKEAKARLRTVTVTNTVERILHEKPSPAICRVNDDAFALMLATVQIANGTDIDEDTAKRVRDKSRSAGPSR